MRIKILLYLFYLLIFSLIIGPLGAIPFGIPQINIYITDIFVGFICLIWITKIPLAVKMIRKDPISTYFCVFAGISVFSLIFSPIHMNLGEKLISGLYIIRLFSYFFVYLTVRYLTGSSTSEESRSLPRHHPRCLDGFAIPGVSLRLLTSMGLILAVIGWVQYFLYPDLRNLYYLGWDPHFRRIFSTFLDPNYFGLMMVLTLISLFSYERFTWKESRRNTLAIFIFSTLMFTYSRSSFLALIGAVIYFSFAKKNFKLLGGILLAILISALLLPRPAGVGVQLERVFSIETRIENWQQAMKIVVDHPIIGVGFNTVRYAKREYNFGQDNLSESHAGAGFDNSFLFVAATTGLLGLVSYLFFLRQAFRNGSVWVKTSLVAIVVHSFFLNSLFFPWIMVWMWIMLGINVKAQKSNVKT